MHMETRAWKNPVVIEMYGRPGAVIVIGTLDAALMLIGAWPKKRTDAHIAAVLCCRGVLTGKADAGLARVNFIEAALEAGYRIEPETFLGDRWDFTPGPVENTRPALGLAELIRKRATATIDRHATAALNEIHQPELVTVANSQPSVLAPESRRPRLRNLLARLLQLLGLIGMEIGRSIFMPLGFGTARRTNRQPQ